MKVLYFLIDRLIITSGAEKKKEELPALSGEFRLTSSQGSRQGQTQRLRQAAGAQAHSTTFEPSPELGPPRTHRLATHPRGGPGLHPKSVFSLPLLLTRLRTTQVHAQLERTKLAFLGPSVVSVEETSCRL